MSQLYKSFIKQLVLYTLVLELVGIGLQMFLPEGIVTPMLPYMILFFFATTAFIHRFLLKSLESRPNKFINAFMIATTIKLLLYFAIILIYVFVNRSDAISFALAFFVLYIFYTIFEILSVLPIARKK